MTTRIENLQSYIKFLGDRWQPDFGSTSIKKLWDAGRKKVNLNFFAKSRYTVFLEKEGITHFLIDLTENEIEAYIEFEQIGQHLWYIFDLDENKIIGKYSPRPKGKGYEHEKI
jgi:hypothetical protein